jgi:Transposase and inactivated derivatives
MELWSEIRRKVLVEGVSKRAICREYGVGWWTLEKMLAHPEPPGYRHRVLRGRPRLGAFVGVIDEILAGDADPSTPRKQRHTARRVFERLRDEHGYAGSEVTVRRYVASHRRVGGEVFVPLSQPAGEAQFDFGEATVEIGGVRVKAALAVMTLPYSDAFFVSAYPRECTETFQAGHVAAFGFFGGVPTKTAYDNTRIAVSRIVGGNERTLTREFLRLESHFLFTHRFCRVARGNEKGHVENLVGYSRRNFLVPVPSFGSFTELNAHLQERCLADLQRRLRGNGQTKAELLEADRAAMLALPANTFEPRRVEQRRANSLSLVRFDRNDYSVPTAYAHHELTVSGGIEQIEISSGTELVAAHPRDWGAEQTAYDPRHYLALLERKPGAFDFARPLEQWDLPVCFGLLRRRLEADLDSMGTREFIKVLRLMEHATLHQLTGAVEAALTIGATSADAVALILFHRSERPVGLFSLDGHPHLKSVQVDPPDLYAYAALTGTGA